eukprot:5872017-Pleurochrysis_carterae.AAC.1
MIRHFLCASTESARPLQRACDRSLASYGSAHIRLIFLLLAGIYRSSSCHLPNPTSRAVV